MCGGDSNILSGIDNCITPLIQSPCMYTMHAYKMRTHVSTELTEKIFILKSGAEIIVHNNCKVNVVLNVVAVLYTVIILLLLL